MSKEEIIEFLREHLEVRVDTSYPSYYTNDQQINVEIWLDGDKLSGDYGTITVPDNE